LWWLLNRAYTVEYVKTVPAKCFSPAPKVKSCLVRLTKKKNVERVDFESLLEFLNLFSPYSRKTL
jgi:16S rRNA A1518/A1519 N6-dimethyltransferase RsmA/KsgA/DIM1 with predicted DNA glycosylase/AP lyase activity